MLSQMCHDSATVSVSGEEDAARAGSAGTKAGLKPLAKSWTKNNVPRVVYLKVEVKMKNYSPS